MEKGFWHERWATNKIGFHESAPNALLTTHFNALALEKGRRVFVPLSGKSLDIGWFLSQGVDAIYDRAALVALPEEMCNRYTRHLTHLAEKAPQLLITFEYDQSVMPGPPFSISSSEVRRHYESSYELTLLEERPVPGGLKGVCPAIEHVWLLTA